MVESSKRMNDLYLFELFNPIDWRGFGEEPDGNEARSNEVFTHNGSLFRIPSNLATR
jgi:hypothetical protein